MVEVGISFLEYIVLLVSGMEDTAVLNYSRERGRPGLVEYILANILTALPALIVPLSHTQDLVFPF